VHLENIRNFQKKLETEADPAKRDLLLKLLAEEIARKFPPVDQDDVPQF